MSGLGTVGTGMPWLEEAWMFSFIVNEARAGMVCSGEVRLGRFWYDKARMFSFCSIRYGESRRVPVR